MKQTKFLNHSIIAYRGIYNNITVFENTMESIMYAVKNNLSVYFDIQMLSDNTIVLFADADLARLIHIKDSVKNCSYEDLEYMSRYHVPTLKEILNYINGCVPIIINIDSNNKCFINDFINIMTSYKGAYAIQSSFLNTLKIINNKLKCVVGLSINENKNKEYLNKQVKVDFLTIQFDLVKKIKINELKVNYYVIGYVIDDREDVDYYIKTYNNIICDRVEEMFS